MLEKCPVLAYYYDAMENTKRRNTDNFIKQGSILAVASIISRIIGLLYRSPVAAIIGDNGNGLYSIAFEVYSVALILSSYSMPLAVSKLLSYRFAKKQYRNGYRVFRYAMMFGALSGLIMTVLILAFAGFIEKVSGYEGLAVPLRVLSPTIFVVAIAGTLRGFFQSRKNMLPTAISQLVEQVVNAIVSIVAAYSFVAVNTEALSKAKWGAAGSTLGTLSGALISLALLAFLFTFYKRVFVKNYRKDTTGITESGNVIMKDLLGTILPVILSQVVYQSVGLIDTFIFGALYSGKASSTLVISYYSKYRTLINVPAAISSSLASSMIPTLVSLHSVGNMDDFRSKLATSIKFNMIIAFPCALGFIALGRPIMRLLFPTTDYLVSGHMLMIGGIAVVFYALSTVTNAALQGMNKMRVPVINSAISLGIHIVLVILLLRFTTLGGYALVIGNMTYPLVVCVLNHISVSKYSGFKQEWIDSFIIPLLCSIVIGGMSYFINMGITALMGSSYIVNLLSVVVCVILSVAVYFALLFKTKALTMGDMPDFPMGMRIARLARRLHLM